MNEHSKIYIAGHSGMVGSAILRAFKANNFDNLLLRSHEELDLTNQKAVNQFFEYNRPEYVIIAAARVGGIKENNTYPADFLYTNLMINANIIKAAHDFKVKKLMAMGSACIYPKFASQPMKEDSLLSGSLEPTNEGYSIGKISALELTKFYKKQYGDDFISCMPTNVYGINDSFDLNASHVIPALIRKFYDAKVEHKSEVIVWGTGAALREFMYVDDLADAILFLMDNYVGGQHINIGTGEEVSIKELTQIIKGIVEYDGDLIFDTTKPEGMPRKLVDSTKLLSMGWKYKVSLEDGIRRTYEYFLEKQK